MVDRIDGAVPAQDDQYPPCDYCGVIPDYHPWHGSGMFNGEDSPHIHACNDCRHQLPARPAQTEQQPIAEVAAVGHWERSLVATWPVDVDDAQGAWIIGTTDEEGNRYEVITIEADQYDAPGDSEKIARALLMLWSQAFSAPIAQTAPRPTGLSQGWNLVRQCDGFVIGHSSAEPEQHHKEQALADGRIYVPFLVAQTAPQPEQSGLVEALANALQSLETISNGAGKDEFMQDMADVRGYARSRAAVARAAMPAQGGEA